jgi:hypothetical protein
MSDDGRYVVFRTDSAILLGSPPDPAQAYSAGIVRRDMVTGAVDLVAPPRVVERAGGAVVHPGVTVPGSISGNGRYVAFDTTEALAAGDENDGADVYVRDMDAPLTDGDAYTLVSALDGTEQAPAYAPGAGSRAGELGFALSDDGRTAVFRTEGASNLPAGGAVSTPTAEVFVRRLDTHRTVLVSADRATGAPAARPDDWNKSPAPVLSGDASAVAWADPSAGTQVALRPGQPQPPAAYLWRDLRADGPARLVSGAADLDDATCPPGEPFDPGPARTGPCYGPFVLSDAVDANDLAAPRSLSISDDGGRVLFLSSARRRPYDAATARESSVFVADMTAGLARKRAVALRVSVAQGNAVTAAVLSGDGTHAVIAADNERFEGPRPIGTFSAPGSNATNAYMVDLAAGTLQRVTVAADGGDYHGPLVDADAGGTTSDPGLRAPALDDDGTAVAFTADDGNLFPGDANGVADVQVVRGTPGLVAAPADAGVVAATVDRPAGVAPVRLAKLRPLHAVFGYVSVDRHGVARVDVRVPAAGVLTAVAAAGRLAVARMRRAARRAETVHVKLVPSRAALHRARHRALRVRLSLTWRPGGGGTAAARRAYKIAKGAR